MLTARDIAEHTEYTSRFIRPTLFLVGRPQFISGELLRIAHGLSTVWPAEVFVWLVLGRSQDRVELLPLTVSGEVYRPARRMCWSRIPVGDLAHCAWSVRVSGLRRLRQECYDAINP